VVAGFAGGLALSPSLEVDGGPVRPVVLLICLLLLTAVGPRLSPAGVGLIVAAALLAGLATGTARLSAIEGNGLKLDPGTEVALNGYAETPARISRGTGRFTFDSTRGRVVVESASLPRGIQSGDGLEVRGTLREPPDWYRSNVERQGITMLLQAGQVEFTGSSRGGLSGAIDRLRNRAQASLSKAMPEREAALARGFVLGQDQDIDPLTVTDFQNAGLAHLLISSDEGQNGRFNEPAVRSTE
jgi:predicted membrane metal-binding protein